MIQCSSKIDLHTNTSFIHYNRRQVEFRMVNSFIKEMVGFLSSSDIFSNFSARSSVQPLRSYISKFFIGFHDHSPL